MREHSSVDPSYFFVNFNDFGDSSLNILCYCFSRSTDWLAYLNAQEDLMLQFMETIEQYGLEIAFPTRTLYLRDERATAQSG